MSKDDSSAALSDESIDFLEDVKKGKPRKFAMICKGTNIVSLVVYKKGSVETRKKEAKESGKGQFYFGVIDGRGMEVSFKLARADGFDSAPVKNVILKQFLEEKADLKFKPIFEIVDSLSLVLDDSDPLVIRFLKLQEAAQRGADAHPDRAAEINELCLEIGKSFDQDQSELALAGIEKLEALLASLGLSQGSTSQPSENSPQPPQSQSPSNPSDAELLTKELADLIPKIKEIIAIHPNMKDELLGSVATIKGEIATEAFENARSGITGLREKLNGLSSSNDPLADWKTMRNWAVNELKEVAKTIAAEKDPKSPKAIIELKAVIANLTEAPKTPQEIKDLKRYLEQDDVVIDVCRYAFDLRTPLLDVLDLLDPSNESQ